MPGCPSVIHITRFSVRKREWRSQCSHYYVCLARNNWIRTTEFSSLFTHSHVVYELSCFRMHCHITFFVFVFLTDIFFNLLLKQQIEFIQNHKNYRSSIDNVHCGSCHKNLKTIGTFALFCYCTTISFFRTIINHPKYF